MASPTWLLKLVPWRLIVGLFTRQLGISHGVDSVANELEYNAEQVSMVEDGHRSADIGALLSFEAWEASSPALHILKHRGDSIWDEISAAYADLRRTAARGAYPPSSATLRGLAERLRATLN